MIKIDPTDPQSRWETNYNIFTHRTHAPIIQMKHENGYSIVIEGHRYIFSTYTEMRDACGLYWKDRDAAIKKHFKSLGER